MISLVRTLAFLSLSCAISLAILRTVRPRFYLPLSLAPLAGLVALYLAYLHPALLVVCALALSLACRSSSPSDPVPAARFPSRTTVVVVAVVFALALSRPWAPIYWDEFVWLAKSRTESLSWGALRAATLRSRSDVIPLGYPPLWPAAVAWISLYSRSAADLVVASSVLTTLCAAALAFAWNACVHTDWQLRGKGHPWLEALPWLALAATPIVLVHLRSAYVDLPVGLLAAATALHLSLALDAEPAAARAHVAHAMTLAFLCAGAKDEGLFHVVAVVLAALGLRSRGRARFAPSLAVLAAALVPVVAWRALLLAHGARNPDHTIEAAAFPAVPALIVHLARHAMDLHTWGLLVPAVALSIVGGLRRSSTSLALTARALPIQLAALLAGLALGPERLRVFVEQGTVLDRALIQLAPMGAVSIVSLALFAGRQPDAAVHGAR